MKKQLDRLLFRRPALAAPPLVAPYMAFLFLLTMFFFFFLLTSAAGSAFRALGFPPQAAMLILLASLGGSWINIPVASLTSEVEEVTFEPGFFGMLYPIPRVERVVRETKIAINLGGCVVPVLVSLYLLTRVTEAALGFFMATIFVSAVCFYLARPVRGVGISIPMLIPPIAAAFSAFVVTRLLALPIADAAAIAYVSGVLGVLLGADVLHLKDVRTLASPIVSIGGAGTFDGIFLTGILSVVLFPA